MGASDGKSFGMTVLRERYTSGEYDLHTDSYELLLRAAFSKGEWVIRVRAHIGERLTDSIFQFHSCMLKIIGECLCMGAQGLTK